MSKEQKTLKSCYILDRLREWFELYGNQNHQRAEEELHLAIDELYEYQQKDQRISDLEAKIAEKEKEIRQLDNEKGMLLNNSMKLLKEKDDKLKSQPAEIVEKINGEIYTRMVVECKKTKYTDINLILNTILKEYQK